MDSERSPRETVGRRALLGTAAAAATAGVAGCLGGGGDATTAGTDTTEAGTGTDTTNSDTGTGAGTPSGERLPTPVAGDPDAPVTVAAYEDYACPHCARYSLEVVPRLFEAYADPGRIRYEFHDFPIPVDRTWSWAAASAARSVQATAGVGTFWSFTKALFERQSELGEGAVRAAAREVGADPDRVAAAAREGRYRETVLADRRAAADRGVEATPTVLVDGRRVDPGYDAIADAVESALG